MFKTLTKIRIIIIIVSLLLTGCTSLLVLLECTKEGLSKKEPTIKQYNYDLKIQYQDGKTIKNVKVIMQCKYNGYRCRAGGIYEDWQQSFYKDNILMKDIVIKTINNNTVITVNTLACEELQSSKENDHISNSPFIEQDVDDQSYRVSDGAEYGLKLNHILYKETSRF